MGFWGHIVAVRSTRPAAELPVLRNNPAWASGGDGDYDIRHVAEGGWQIVDVHSHEALPLDALAHDSGAPVLAAYILDSDGANLTGFGPASGLWEGWIGPGGSSCYAIDDPYAADEAAFDAAEARIRAELPERARQAVAWAEEAGLTPAPDAVLAAMQGHETFAEDLFFSVLAALGVPGIPDGQD